MDVTQTLWLVSNLFDLGTQRRVLDKILPHRITRVGYYGHGSDGFVQREQFLKESIWGQTNVVGGRRE